MANGAPAALEGDASDVESSIWRALLLRSAHLKGQAESLTLPGVRRLLEEDLGLETSQLDAHKQLIKILVDKVLNNADDGGQEKSIGGEKRKKKSKVVEDLDEGDSKTDGSTERPSNKRRRLVRRTDVEEVLPDIMGEGKFGDDGISKEATNEVEVEMPEYPGDVGEKAIAEGKEGPSKSLAEAGEESTHVHEDVQDPSEDPVEKNEKSVVIASSPPQEFEEDCDEAQPPEIDGERVTEDTIRTALMKRADELKSQAESLTLTSVRRLLQEDLGTGPDGLEGHRKFLRSLVDEILGDSDEKPPVKALKAGRPKQGAPKASGDSKGHKRAAAKSSSAKKRVKGEETEESEDNLQANGEVSDSVSEGRKTGKVRKKKSVKPKTKTVAIKTTNDGKKPFSANVERLRDILKAVGIGVPPILYRKAKQAPEDERDEILTKELENKLREHGLSSNPSEKEIRSVKTRLQKTRDLDGIERSNIVAEPRRSRAAANSWFAPRPNSYAKMADADDSDSPEKGSDDDEKPAITGAMDD